MNLTHNPVITGVEMMTGSGVGADAAINNILSDTPVRPNPCLADLDVRQLLPDRKVLKTISQTDAVALAAVARLKEQCNGDQEQSSPWRRGVYVSAQPSTADDNQYYFDAVEESQKQVREFGARCMQSKPVTLLIGLPNNVLCYGSMLWNAKGPNSNYTAVEHCAHISVMQAARRVGWGKLDLAVAGGFNGHHNNLDTKVLQANGLYSDASSLCDGAAFCLLETRQNASANGRRPFAEVVAWGSAQLGRPPFNLDDDRSSRFAQAISLAIHKGGISPDDIGLVLAGAARESTAETCELLVLSRVFAKARGFPALGLFPRVTGDLMQASGILELAALNRLYDRGKLPPAIVPQMPVGVDGNFTTAIDPEKPYVLLTKVSCSGQATCLLVKREKE